MPDYFQDSLHLFMQCLLLPSAVKYTIPVPCVLTQIASHQLIGNFKLLAPLVVCLLWCGCWFRSKSDIPSAIFRSVFFLFCCLVRLTMAFDSQKSSFMLSSDCFPVRSPSIHMYHINRIEVGRERGEYFKGYFKKWQNMSHSHDHHRHGHLSHAHRHITCCIGQRMRQIKVLARDSHESGHVW